MNRRYGGMLRSLRPVACSGLARAPVRVGVSVGSRMGLRFESTGTVSDENPFKVAIVGSGPAGFYTAYRLLSKLPNARVDMFESLPAPFGLSRFGVAPDHPEVKNCQEKFEEVAGWANFRFFGNVSVGDIHKSEKETVSLQQLHDNYNSIVLAYGSSKDRMLGVKGEELEGVMSARQFVGWYNGHPEFSYLNPPLEDAEDAIIVGNGNVALDVARMLLSDVSRLKSTDITEQAYETLKKSRVKNVRIVARRGLLQSAFTTKEVRELVREPGSALVPLEEEYMEPYRQFGQFLDRKTKRLIQVLDKAREENEKKDNVTRSWRLDYLRSPVQFYKHGTNERLLSSAKFQVNTLIQDDIKSPASAVATDDSVMYKCELAFRSIGYNAVPLRGFEELSIPFDTRRGAVSNEYGRVVTIDRDSGHAKALPGYYVAGWVKNGPTGVIAETMRESFEVAETILEDYYSGKLDTQTRAGYEGLNVGWKSISWADWLKIDQAEKERGKLVGKEREKFANVEQMMNVVS